MSPDAGTPPFQEWHAALRERDDSIHAAEDERMRREAVDVLEQRAAAMNAELRARTEAIHLRDVLLSEQRLALAERDELIAGLNRDLKAHHAALLEAHHAALLEARNGPLRQLARRARRVAGRAVRRVLQ